MLNNLPPKSDRPSKGSMAAKKAWATRRRRAKKAAVQMVNQARKDYRSQYGDLSYNVMKYLSKGQEGHAVMLLGGNTSNVNGRLAAYQANLTRNGTQRELAIACNFGL